LAFETPSWPKADGGKVASPKAAIPKAASPKLASPKIAIPKVASPKNDILVWLYDYRYTWDENMIELQPLPVQRNVQNSDLILTRRPK